MLAHPELPDGPIVENGEIAEIFDVTGQPRGVLTFAIQDETLHTEELRFVAAGIMGIPPENIRLPNRDKPANNAAAHRAGQATLFRYQLRPPWEINQDKNNNPILN